MNELPFASDFPTIAQVELFNKSCEELFRQHAEASNYRMSNYFNCVDDYSWGGICDQAQDQERGKRLNAMQLLKEQAEHGKPMIEEFTVNFLADANGNVVSDQIVNGKYGACWIIKDGERVSFVGTAKKQATYNKKGYKLMERVYTIEYYYTTKLCKNGLISRGRVLSEQVRDVVDMPNYQSSQLHTVAYFALRNN